MWNEEMQERVNQRITYISRLFLVIIIILSLRFWYLSILQGDWYKQKSEQNRVRIISLPPIRGSIYDRNNQVLAEDVPHFRLVWEKGGTQVRLEEIEKRVEKVLKKELSPPFPGRGVGEIILVDSLSLEEVIKIEEAQNDLPGVMVESYPVRYYPRGEPFAHVVGYVGKINAEELELLRSDDYEIEDRIGKVGVEREYESFLRGKKGYRRIEVNALGEVVGVLDYHFPYFENSIVLTLDQEFQEYSYELLGDRSGVIIAGDPYTGELLALVSKPSFDPQLLSKGMTPEEWNALVQDQNRPLTNRPLQALYPPGSLFKLVIATGALEEGITSGDRKIFCPGFLDYNTWRYPCWRRGGHGAVGIEEAIAQSCNVTFYTLGLELGPDKIINWANQLGVGQSSGIDLPGEKTAFLPTPEWKKRQLKEMWYPGDTINLSIGQGYLLVTPFEMYRVVSNIATRGEVYKPHVVKKILDSEGKVVREITPVRQDTIKLKDSTWKTLIQGMEKVVKRGTGQVCRSLPVELAAKTGTAQNPQGEDHSWFAGFFPSSHPRMVFLVLVEHGGDGSGEAAQLAKKLIEWWIENRGENGK
ncbi:MAG: penicillin-binding protein 2 [Candidatus Atribacteria bacterium]|nr:penicillin-binding protein 2 [Candidatus Atribacteria bacterium]